MSLSDKGLLTIVFSRELSFPQATLQEYVPSYIPTLPEVQFRMTNVKKVIALDADGQQELDYLQKDLAEMEIENQ